ncbi:MAG: response regulator transcription factor [Arachnia propionica]|uniref:response regulator transcription factor n=1 Tax=Arachnia propionica TaxID=1750 RepID=UPI0027108AFB|nr:response regulator transcription factor [Arachnia propionica]
MSLRIRVGLVDDEAALRGAMRMLVDSDPGMVVVGEASDGAAALELARETHPDVLLMDVQMPGMGGLEAARRLGELSRGPRIIMLTVFDLDEYVQAALAAGVAGFLLKNSPPVEILHAIRVVHAGNALLAPEVTRRLIGRMAPRDPAMAERIAALTLREREALRLVAQGLSNDELAAGLHVTPATARTYVGRLLGKLGARDRAQLVVIAYEGGLM